jgi:transcriptional regulator with XRE-family HTH domain
VPLQTISVGAGEAKIDREVVRCLTCGLIQYRTKNGFCRRCLRLLPCPMTFRLPDAAPQPQNEIEGAARPISQNSLVKNIGARIRQLRESRGITQSQLQDCSRVSRSYLSRIEGGQMTPSLGTLEKIGQALGIGLHNFFIPELRGESLIRDDFIQDLRPMLRQLDYDRWQYVLRRLAIISGQVESEQINGERRTKSGRGH